MLHYKLLPLQSSASGPSSLPQDAASLGLPTKPGGDVKFADAIRLGRVPVPCCVLHDDFMSGPSWRAAAIISGLLIDLSESVSGGMWMGVT